MPSQDSVNIIQSVDRIRAGDPLGAEELFRTVGHRLEHLARRMLYGFPTVRPYADSTDIVQGASIRLLNALRELRPGSSREFFNLAAVQVRRELLDLARRYSGRCWKTADESSRPEPHDRSPEHGELDLWTRFHEAVENLPTEEREAVGLLFYHGRTQGEAAEILGVSERTLQRWWQAGCELLKLRLGNELPAM